MTRKEKLALRQHQSTRQLMGMQGIASHGITTSNSELVFFLIRPDNLSVLSSEGIRARVTALANLLRAEPAVELLVVDSRESFQRNKEFYQKRLEEETTPAIRKLLIEDTDANDDYLNVYADFDLDVGEVCDALTVIQVCGDGSEETYRYPLTEEDRSILRAKMNDYCMEQTGLSLDDYRAQYLDEDMCASSFPDGQSM